MSLRINLNDVIRVELTPTGRAILRSFNLRFDPKFQVPTARQIEMPLWEFMQVFGPVLHIGMSEVVTKENAIELIGAHGTQLGEIEKELARLCGQGC